MPTTATSTINIRIPSEEKAKAEAILSTLGINTSEAIRMYFRQIVFTGGLPFDLKLPPKTRQAMQDAEEGRVEPLTLESLHDQLAQIS